ncbi:dTDP-glucose 4,6-dehydratase [Streptomyces sp. NPDC002643]
MKILVTGGAGFIGSHFVRSYAGQDELTVLDKLTYAGNLANLEPAEGRFTFVHGDICDAGLLAELVPGHDLVVNFAAESHVDRSIADADAFVHSNILGVQTLMQACLDAGTPRVVHVSTDEVYGSIDTGSWDETAPLSPNSPYAAAKAGGDLIALAHARTHGLPVSITRCGNNYGPYQYPEKLIPLFVTNLLDGLPVPLYGDGGNIRDWVHVDDHCRAIRLVADRGEPGGIYHIPGTAELTNLDLTSRLLTALDATWQSVHQAQDRKAHDRRYSLTDTKLRAFGHKPRITFEEGLRETIEWYTTNRAWWEPLMGRRPKRGAGLYQCAAPPRGRDQPQQTRTRQPPHRGTPVGTRHTPGGATP